MAHAGWSRSPLDTMKEIRIFLKPRTSSPLELGELPQRFGLKKVATPAEADWIVAPRIRSLLPFMARFPFKRFLAYTNEPRLCAQSKRQSTIIPLLPPVEVMGVFTGDVFWHNFHFLGSFHYDIKGTLDTDIYRELPILTSREVSPGRKTVAAFVSYRLNSDTSFVIDGIDRDLEVKRATCARDLFKAGLCDVYGSDWPDGIARESSGYQSQIGAKVPWWTSKLRDLAHYRFNLCLENTAADYYCTEKIWHAIQAGTLPIYWGRNTTIYDVFPKGSFIDLAEFESNAHLIDFLKALPESEYLARNNQCREVFNRCIAERRETIAADPDLHMERIVARLRK
jgi:hypothetical protein